MVFIFLGMAAAGACYLICYWIRTFFKSSAPAATPIPTPEQLPKSTLGSGTAKPVPSPIARPTPAHPVAMPKCIAFLDVETTGLTDKDRIVTLAGVKVPDADRLGRTSGTTSLEYLYLIFDPAKRSHPRAEAVHGYSDWVLRHQDSFEMYAEQIEQFFNSAELVVAHNAEFDLSFYNREMERAARQPIATAAYCTMNAYRQRVPAGSSSLDTICRIMGAVRQSRTHGALEDAWLAMQVYLWLNYRNSPAALPAQFKAGPSNFKETPPLPDGPLPRRKRKAKAMKSAEAAP